MGLFFPFLFQIRFEELQIFLEPSATFNNALNLSHDCIFLFPSKKEDSMAS